MAALLSEAATLSAPRSAFSSDSRIHSRRNVVALSGLSASTRGPSLGQSASPISTKFVGVRSKSSKARGHRTLQVVASGSPLKVIISGAPASGKGTQCELIVEKFGLVHISAGDLLRAEVAEGTPNGTLAQSYMDAGQLVPDEVVVNIVKERLKRGDAEERGWLLDGFPRSESQGLSLAQDGVVPDAFILLNVPDEVIVERVEGRRSDPVTGKIYHLTFSPPPNDPEILERLVQRSDDTRERCQARLDTHARNVNSVLSLYEGKISPIDGNRPKNEIFAEIQSILKSVQEKKEKKTAGTPPPREQDRFTWRGMPTKLLDCPHSREIREYFYEDVCQSSSKAVRDGLKRMQIDLIIPELNPEMDVYRIGTLLELMRELAFTFAAQGKNVKVCVQGAMGSGIFAGMPLQLSGTRRLLELMDWGQDEEIGEKGSGLAQRIAVGAIGAADVTSEDEVFILMAPQNAVGNCILENLEAMCDAAGPRPVILVNPRLKDIPSASGVMQVRGRAERLAFQDSFMSIYVLRLLFLAGSLYPILGAVRLAYPGLYEVYKRENTNNGEEKYSLCDTFPTYPTSAEISGAMAGRKRTDKEEKPKGIWAFLSSILG